jgi:ubiquinone/menaquinone biosynthesis C-methylase UbiE
VSEREPKLPEPPQDLVPPEELRMWVLGPVQFLWSGQVFLRDFVKLADLKPSDDVLDIGCGLGRMAVAMTNFLEPESRYEGLDIVPEAIEWCSGNITPRYPNFNFQRVNVYNEVRYNPEGQIRARDFTFPYEDDSFDFVICHSIFTHMYPEDVTNYISEISRVLRAGGKFYATYFLINEESLPKMESGEAMLTFPELLGSHRMDRKECPDGMIAHDEKLIMDLYERSGLEIRPVHYGYWIGRDPQTTVTRQDVVIADRSGD